MAVRLLTCWLIFGLLASGLHGVGEGLAICLAAPLPIALNSGWRKQQERERRQRVLEDEKLRRSVWKGWQS